MPAAFPAEIASPADSPPRAVLPAPGAAAALGAALGGPLVLGAVLGLAADEALGAAALRGALTLPTVLGGVALMTAPALYVAIALAGAAPSAGACFGAFLRAARAGGIVLLGFAPAAAFLVATGPTAEGARLLAGCIVAAGGFAAFRILFGDLQRPTGTCAGCRRPLAAAARECAACRRPALDPGRRLRVAVLFAAWALVTVVLGSRFLFLAIA